MDFTLATLGVITAQLNPLGLSKVFWLGGSTSFITLGDKVTTSAGGLLLGSLGYSSIFAEGCWECMADMLVDGCWECMAAILVDGCWECLAAILVDGCWE